MKAGRPRKQRPWRPGAPAPIQAAGCGPERRLAVRQPNRPGSRLRLKHTPTGHAQDWLEIQHRRKKKGSAATVINDIQYLAGKQFQHLADIAAKADTVKSIDWSVPTVDRSFTYPIGVNQDRLEATARLIGLRQYIGPRAFQFLWNVLHRGTGIDGAILHAAGHEWRCPPDRDEDQRSRTVDPRTGEKVPNSGKTDVQLASGILEKNRAVRITADFADAAQNKGGSFEVEPGIKERPVHSPHQIPHGTLPDRGAEIEQRAKDAVADVVRSQREDIRLEALRDEMADLKLEIKRGGDVKEIRLRNGNGPNWSRRSLATLLGCLRSRRVH